MRILGHTGIKPRTRTVRIGESEDGTPLELVLTAPSLNVMQSLDEVLVPPDPPAKPTAPMSAVQRDGRGRVVKDGDGKPIALRNDKDPAYLEQLAGWRAELAKHEEVEARYNRAKTIGMLLACMGDQVEPSASREDYTDGNAGAGAKGGLVDYYDAVWAEFEAFGLDLVILARLMEAMQQLAGLADEEVEQARSALGASSGN